jgi:hypothetical protein
MKIMLKRFDMTDFNAVILSEDSTLSESIMEFLATHLSEQQKQVQEFLHDYSDRAFQFYNTGMYLLIKKEINPSVNKVLFCHCFYSVTEVLLESDELAQKEAFTKRIIDDLHKTMEKIGCFESDVYKDVLISPGTNGKINNMWDCMANLSKDKAYKWHFFIKQLRPKITEKEMNDLVGLIKKTNSAFHDGRHYNKNAQNNNDYIKVMNDFDNFILAMKQPFVELKGVLDDILAKANKR